MKRKVYRKETLPILFVLVLVCGLLIFSSRAPEEKQNQRALVPTVKKAAPIQPVRAVSMDIDLRDLDHTPLSQRAVREMRPVLNFKRNIKITEMGERDQVVQSSHPKSKAPTPVTNFTGMDFNTWGAGWPPDTTGDVGKKYYIQAVNTSIAIYDKTTGQEVQAFTFNSFFQGSGLPAATSNRGDPLVLYDQYADRWLISDFAWLGNSGPSYLNIAVSKTSDPISGGWWMYGYLHHQTLLNDYPKWGVWHDAYYITVNLFGFSGGYYGVRVSALDRNQLLSGTLVGAHVDDDNWYAYSILPANSKGATLPPITAPNYMFAIWPNEWGGLSNDSLLFYKFNYDNATPANSTLSGPWAYTVAAFSMFSGDIPTPGVALDDLSDRLMYPAFYRNYGSEVDAVYLNHTVSVGGVAAQRWYEVRNLSGTPSIHQQGTYAPDANHRWMGSIAADKHGNIAMGYSVANTSMHPSIRYAGRLSSDPLGTLPLGETSIVEGTSSQTTYNRWGDYSTMTIDPVNDATFWFTTEFHNFQTNRPIEGPFASTTGLNWQTRIAAMRLGAQHPEDFLGTWTGQGVYYRNSSDGSWVYLASPASQITSGDLDNDGVDDLIGIWPSQGGVWVLYSSTGTWTLLSSTAQWIAAGDMNGDSRDDLVGTWNGQGVYYLNSATGSWVYLASPADKIFPGDLDADGTKDIIGIWPSQGGVWVKYSNSGTWALLSSTADWISAGDMDGDGIDDMLGTWTGQGVYYLDSGGSWNYLASPASQIAAGDIDADGTKDLLGIWPSQGGVWVRYFTNGSWAQLSTTADWISAGWMRAGALTSATNRGIRLDLPSGGSGGGPSLHGKFNNLSSYGPGGVNFKFTVQKNAEVGKTIDKARQQRIQPGPGSPGFKPRKEDKGSQPDQTKIKK